MSINTYKNKDCFHVFPTLGGIETLIHKWILIT